MARVLVAAALAVAALLSVATGCRARRPWNVLVVTLDTTRADHLGCYGKESARTPNLDRLAAEGTLFSNCVSAAPVTTPSHSTIFTGLYPPAHGVRDNGLFALPEGSGTLASRLRGAGWSTGAAVASFPLTRGFGLAQGFDFYDDHITVLAEGPSGERVKPFRGSYFDERPAARVNDAVLPWLRRQAREPFFAWVHYWDPHQPLVPPPPFNQLFAHDLYQGEIAYVDQCLGTLLAELRARGLGDRTLVVVVGDHGEGRGEHDELSHSMLAYDSTLHVPLLIRAPGAPAGRRVAQRVGTVDLLPTVLALLGQPVPAGLDGRSLAPLVTGAEPESASRRLYYAETFSPRLSYGWGELRALYSGPTKLIHGPRTELFDLSSDPEEVESLAAARPGEVERMTEALSSFLRTHARPAAAGAVRPGDEETRRRLESLGYLTGAGAAPSSVEALRTDGTAPQDRVGDVNLWSRVKAQLDEGSFLEARELALELVAREPANTHYRMLLLQAWAGIGRLDEAARVAEESASLSHSGNDVLRLAELLFASGERRRGLALAERAVAEKESAPGRFLLAEMRRALGEKERADEDLRATLRLEPRFDKARSALALALAESGTPEGVAEAEVEFRQLLRDRPLDVRAHFNYGLLLMKSGRLEEGASSVRRAIELHPSYWEAHLALLAARVDQGLREEAAEILRRLEADCREPAILGMARKLAGKA